MPEESVKENQPSSGLTEVRFQKSVPMVSYLVVVIICEFTYVEKSTAVHKIPMRVYGKTGEEKRLQYALDIGSAISDHYATYFNIEYPLPKLDMAAIPDYSSGATEHWGMV